MELFEPRRRPEDLDTGRGYLDLLDPGTSAGGSAAQRLMLSRALPLIYERFWRRLGGRALVGLSSDEEHKIALETLSISARDRVLDVACGPGNFTREFALAASDGLVVGLDASETMLGVAVRDTGGDNVAYVRGDARDLPFRDGCFDAVCCYAALYLIEEPMRALDEIVRVLAPGGRLALMSTCARGSLPQSVTDGVVRKVTGVRVFGRGELTGALTREGMIDMGQGVAGLAQFVSARKAPAARARRSAAP